MAKYSMAWLTAVQIVRFLISEYTVTGNIVLPVPNKFCGGWHLVSTLG